MYPASLAVEVWLTTRLGGSRVGREWKCIFSPGSFEGCREGGWGRTSSRAMTNWKEKRCGCPPAETLPVTLTVSPETNGAEGRKLAPPACEKARRRPPWAPPP